MATNDLMTELQKDSIKLDDDSERKVVKMILKLLEDKNGEVQNLAVKWYVFSDQAFYFIPIVLICTEKIWVGLSVLSSFYKQIRKAHWPYDLQHYMVRDNKIFLFFSVNQFWYNMYESMLTILNCLLNSISLDDPQRKCMYIIMSTYCDWWFYKHQLNLTYQKGKQKCLFHSFSSLWRPTVILTSDYSCY